MCRYNVGSSIFFKSFKRTILAFYLKKKKEIGKPGNLKVGVLLTKIRKKNIGLFDFVEFYTGLNF